MTKCPICDSKLILEKEYSEVGLIVATIEKCQNKCFSINRKVFETIIKVGDCTVNYYIDDISKEEKNEKVNNLIKFYKGEQ